MAADDPLRADAETLKSHIGQAQKGYDQGLEEYQNNRSSQAFQTWAKVVALDQQIVGKQSSQVANQIAAHMAVEFYRRAQRAFDAGEYAKARENAAKALRADPEHAGSVAINQRLAAKARRIYEEGYILEDLNPNQAVDKWRQVLRICPPDNEYYQKAQTKIAKYAR